MSSDNRFELMRSRGASYFTSVLGAGDPSAVEAVLENISRRAAFEAMEEAYRRWGWLAADLNPLSRSPAAPPAALSPDLYGFLPEDAENLRHRYCGKIGWEIGHIQDDERRQWMAEQIEADCPIIDYQDAIDLIAKAELFEATCAKRLPTAKTFGLSGTEGFLVLLAELLREAQNTGAAEVLVGGMHRGRMTQSALVFGKPLTQVVADIQGVPEFPHHFGASLDSPYHLGWQGTSPMGPSVWVAPHPSHLSIVPSVVMGRARAAQERGHNVLPVALHTDAALAGQGINGELFQLSGLPAFSVGGMVHLVLNNQIGFTTNVDEARTSRCCTDYAKLVEAPVLHVNAEAIGQLIHAARIAVAYRKRFQADVVIECVGFRRFGHNEIDEPRFTQPGDYKHIDEISPLSDRLAVRHGIQPDPGDFARELDRAFQHAKSWHPNLPPVLVGLKPEVNDLMLRSLTTGLPETALRKLGDKLTSLPASIKPHPKIDRFLALRQQSFDGPGAIDWATAEALALSSISEEGHHVRFGGQDSVRGAFAQRHFHIYCSETGAKHSIFSSLRCSPRIHNTPLTEAAVLAFEYGHSTEDRSGLTIWEAQFGDFLNVGQSVFDQFITCGENRWLLESNLVLLLPHGIDGGGPDHATAHPERFLLACARNNIQVMNPSTPANYFHALRRQVIAEWRKPLVVLAPKTLLRTAGARSELRDFASAFRPVLHRKGDKRRVVMSCGKLSVLLEKENSEATLVRLEQFYPFPKTDLKAVLDFYPDAELIWAQEEPENMGYFQWLSPRLEELSGRPWRLVTRPENPAASSGPKCWDDLYLRDIIESALLG